MKSIVELITICYTGLQREVLAVNQKTKTLYTLPDIEKYEDIHLLTLSENCAVLEEQVLSLTQTLPDQYRLCIEEYIRMRNDLEFETIKTALRWGKAHYK